MTPQTGAALKKEQFSSVREAFDSYYDALNRVFEGDMALMESVWSHSDDTLFLGSFGSRQSGWKDIRDQYVDRFMKLRGRITAGDVKVIEFGDTAVATCWERGNVSNGDGNAVAFAQRALSVFHKEGGSWKLFCHQADPSPRLQGIDFDHEGYGQDACDD